MKEALSLALTRQLITKDRPLQRLVILLYSEWMGNTLHDTNSFLILTFLLLALELHKCEVCLRK